MQIQVSWSGEGGGRPGLGASSWIRHRRLLGSPSPEPLCPSEAALVSAAVERRRSRVCSRAQLRPPRHGSPRRARRGDPGDAATRADLACRSGGVHLPRVRVLLCRHRLGGRVGGGRRRRRGASTHRRASSSGASCHLRSGARWNGSIDGSRGPPSCSPSKKPCTSSGIRSWRAGSISTTRLSAWIPTLGRFEVSVIGQPAPSVPPALRRIEGRFDIVGRHVVSAVALREGGLYQGRPLRPGAMQED